MGDACQGACASDFAKDQLRTAGIDGIPGNIFPQIKTQNMSVIGSIFHAVNALDGIGCFLQQRLHFRVAGNGIVVRQRKGVDTVCCHMIQQVLTAQGGIGFCSVIVQLQS